MSTSNAVGRLTQAATDDCSWPITQASIVTDQWFSYSPRGETTDVWESTRHSGGYYHSTASYYANGALNMLNPLNNAALPTITYGVDGEGRPNTAGASSGMNPVLSTAYDVASRVTGVTLGTYDSDAFTFDPNSGRVTQYKFTVGATPTTVTGNIGWNANGTLASLGITDQFNSANTQNCTYSHDDLVRISGVNCGSVWQQSFGFDPFGNLTKSGNANFQVSYDTSKNQIGPGQGFTYDASGNTTHDNVHAYSWDVQGHAVSVDAIGLTYDALGRMVEQQRGSSYTQILYGPTGKLALMNGQAVTKAFIPLPAGATAVYLGSTLSYFRHPDWLGSSRFASTPGRTMYYSGAYAPFGEAYAEAGTADRSFTGQNQDTVPGSTTGLYDFLFREYAQYGRWISPDPAGLGAVDPTNPQSWNRYAYVLNSPINLVDPLGLYYRCKLVEVPHQEPKEVCVWVPDPQNPDGIRADFRGALADFWNWLAKSAVTQAQYDDKNGCGPGKGPCGASVPANKGKANTGDVPVGMDIFRNSPQCPNCGDTWQNTNQVTDPRTMLLWYGGAACAGGGCALIPGALDAAAVSLETAGVPVTAASRWTINNWNNLGRIGGWLYNQCKTYGPC